MTVLESFIEVLVIVFFTILIVFFIYYTYKEISFKREAIAEANKYRSYAGLSLSLLISLVGLYIEMGNSGIILFTFFSIFTSCYYIKQKGWLLIFTIYTFSIFLIYVITMCYLNHHHNPQIPYISIKNFT